MRTSGSGQQKGKVSTKWNSMTAINQKGRLDEIGESCLNQGPKYHEIYEHFSNLLISLLVLLLLDRNIHSSDLWTPSSQLCFWGKSSHPSSSVIFALSPSPPYLLIFSIKSSQLSLVIPRRWPNELHFVTHRSNFQRRSCRGNAGNSRHRPQRSQRLTPPSFSPPSPAGIFQNKEKKEKEKDKFLSVIPQPWRITAMNLTTLKAGTFSQTWNFPFPDFQLKPSLFPKAISVY